MRLIRGMLAGALIVVAVPQVGRAQSPRVTSVHPPPQTIQASSSTAIVIKFSTPLDAQSISSSTIRVFGRWSGPASGILQLEDDDSQVRFDPDEPMAAGEWVTVSVAKGVKSSGGIPMSKGYTWNFWIRATPGTIDLREIERLSIRRPSEPNIKSYGAYAGDLNNDGWSDLSIPNELSNDVRVFLNDEAGSYRTFTIYPLPGGATPSTNEGADFDADGNIDLAIGNTTSSRVSVLMGTGGGGFQPEVAYAAGSSVRGLGIVDLDGDGNDDIVTANRTDNNISLLTNTGSGVFASPVNMDTGGDGETSCVIADANGDGIHDVFVGALRSREVILLLGDGAGGLAFSSRVDASGAPWMLAVGDVNGDHYVDVVAANSFMPNAAVILGDGQGGLQSAVTYEVGSFPLAIDLGDIDGDLDMVTSNYAGNSWTVYENAGDGTFSAPRTFPSGTSGSCAILHDRDNDGDLDMSGIDEEDDLLILFENALPATSNPSLVRLLPNHPNPFNPSTTIPFTLDISRRVTISIYDAAGHHVRTIADDAEPGANTVEWDGRDADGKPVSSGVYFYRLTAGDTERSRRMVLVR